MDGFDDAGVFFSDNFSEVESSQATTNQAVKKQLNEFIRTFQEGNFAYKYRDALKSNYLRWAAVRVLVRIIVMISVVELEHFGCSRSRFEGPAAALA